MRTWIVLTLMTLGALLAVQGTARADVTGEVTLQLGFIPLATQTEAVEFNIDFEVLSDIRWTVSGITFRNRLAMGVPGLEHDIVGVETRLGAIDVSSDIVFATPFSNGIPDDIDLDGIPNSTDPDIDGDGQGNLVDATPFGPFEAFIKDDIDGDGQPNEVDPDIDGDGEINALDPTPFGTNFVITPLVRPIGPTVFVKKRIQTSINLAGFTLTNLAIFEDFNFTHPFLNAVQTYGAEAQEFRFGDIITVVGQTVSGINIRSVTGIGADPDVPNLVKKASFSGSLCQDVNEGASILQNFAFCVEQLFIDNIQIGSLTVNSRTEFRILPLVLSETLNLSHRFFNDAVNVTMALDIDNLLTLSPLSTSIFLNSTPLTLSFSLDSTLAITSATATVSTSIDSALFSATAVFLPATGINSVSFTFQTVSLSGLSVFANTVLSNPGAGPNGSFGNFSTTFTINGNINDVFGVNASMSFTNNGLTLINARLSYRF